MKISIGADHGGIDLRSELLLYLKQEAHEYLDHGTLTHDSVDYPDYAKLVGGDIQSQRSEIGILICTTGMGVCMSANKLKGIRAALAFNEDVVHFSRLHNNANVICFAGKYHTPYMAKKLLKIFMETQYEGGRHQKRIEKMTAYYDKQLNF